jgi:Lipopolysaccharide assembly protein A domain
MKLVRRVLWIAFTAALVVAGVAFVGRNRVAVPIDLGVTTFPEAPLWQALLVAFAAGAALVGLGALWQVARLGMLARRYRRTVARLESEIHQLRNLPLAAEDAPGRNSELGSARTATRES